MATYQKIRGADGGFTFRKDGQTITLEQYMQEADNNLFRVLSDSQNVDQLLFLRQSLQQNYNKAPNPAIKQTIDKIGQDVTRLQEGAKIKANEAQNLAALGLTSDVIANMSQAEKEVLSRAGYEKIKNVNNQIPITNPLSDAVLDRIKKDVQKDPAINRFETREIGSLVENVKTRVQQLQFSNEQFATQFTAQGEQARDTLSRNAEALGQTFSPVRQQSVERLQDQEAGILASFENEQKQSLQSLGLGVERAVGTEKAKTQFGDILTLNNTLSGTQTNYTPSTVDTTYQESSIGRQVGDLQRNQQQIEIDRIKTLNSL